MASCQSSGIQYWDQTLLQLHQLGLTRRDSQVRISFAYLFRVRVHDKYMLVQNEHRSSVYQPIGGAYQYNPREIKFLIENFQVRNDFGDIPDISKPGDYRLLVPGIYLKSFLQRFDQTTDRESIADLSREFVEETIDTDILSFSKIKYRFCGRHISKIHFSDFYQCYELLIADIVELLPDNDQFNSLSKHLSCSPSNLLFATSLEVENTQMIGQVFEDKPTIAEHTYKILCQNENSLYRGTDDSHTRTYEVELKRP